MRLQNDWLPDVDHGEPDTRVLVADRDPISRHVLGEVLRRTGQFDVVACVEGDQPMRTWPLSRVDVVVLAATPREDITLTVRELVSRRIRVLLIGVGWTRGRLDAAFAAGVAGCLVKNTEVGGLAAAAQAVASGHTVLSPELHGLYTVPAHPFRGTVPSQASRRAGSPEHLLRLLTQREHKVLALLAEGLSTAEAAADLHVSPATIKSHVSHALTKLGVRNRLEAVLLVRQLLESRRDLAG